MKGLIKLLSMETDELAGILGKKASWYGKECWLFEPKEKENKVCLVAHIDTVWDRGEGNSGFSYGGTYYQYSTQQNKGKEKKLRYTRDSNELWSPQGLGADDRAGVWMALRLWETIPEPYKPYVLLTSGEESGGSGAYEASSLLEDFLKNVLFFLELDRRGENDVVFYNREPREFRDWFKGFGLEEEWGTFSDISIIGEALEICGANISVGYEHEHSTQETLNLKWLRKAYDTAEAIVREGTLEERQWKLEFIKGTGSGMAYDDWGRGDIHDLDACPYCYRPMKKTDFCCHDCGWIVYD